MNEIKTSLGMPKKLFDDNQEIDPQLNLNRSYADKYNCWREKEEHQKLKDIYGDLQIDQKNEVNVSTSTSESESELEDESFKLTIEDELKSTLKMLKEKDPRIYDKGYDCFKDSQKILVETEGLDSTVKCKAGKKKNKKKNIMTINDYERHIIQNKAGIYTDEEDELPLQTPNPTFVQEQKILKDSFKNIFNNQKDEDNDENDLFKITSAPSLNTSSPHSNHKNHNQENLFPSFPTLKTLFDKYRVDEENSDKIGPQFPPLTDPTTGDHDLSDTSDRCEPTLSPQPFGDDEDPDSQSNTERPSTSTIPSTKYRFRFEELQAQRETGGNAPPFIKSFPRILPPQAAVSLLRRPTDRSEKRRSRREARVAAKRAQRLRVLEDTKRMRGTKLKQIRGKLDRLEKVSGIGHLDSLLTLEDIEKDYDPDRFDQIISKMFDEKYYKDCQADKSKPVFDDTDEELDDAKASSTLALNRNESRTIGDYSDNSGKGEPGVKEDIQSLKQDLDDYCNLNFEGVVAGKPTRFKYRKVTANQFGLTLKEILEAEDKELNKWVSLKKAVQYRTDQEEKFDLHAYAIRGKHFYKKKAIFNSLYGPDPETEAPVIENDAREADPTIEKSGATDEFKSVGNDRKVRKKKRAKVQIDNLDPKGYDDQVPIQANQKIIYHLPSAAHLNEILPIKSSEEPNDRYKLVDAKPKSSRPKAKYPNHLIPSDQRLLTYGINPKNYKKKLKYKNGNKDKHEQ